MPLSTYRIDVGDAHTHRIPGYMGRVASMRAANPGAAVAEWEPLLSVVEDEASMRWQRAACCGPATHDGPVRGKPSTRGSRLPAGLPIMVREQ